MKKIKWKNPNKMEFESDHKTFNNFIICISTGNCVGDGQLSSYIRPYMETKCNGATFEKGHLQQHDLSNFKGLPFYIREYIEHQKATKSNILYKFFYYNGYREIVLGYILTNEIKKLVMYWNETGTQKTESALRECMKYITN